MNTQKNLNDSIFLLEHLLQNKINLKEIQQQYCPHLNTLKDKGWKGKIVEFVLGIPPNNNARDFYDGELKTTTSTYNKNGELALQETVCVQVLNPNELISTSFEESSFYLKSQKILFVLIDKNTNQVTQYKIAEFGKQPQLYEQIKNDYNDIVEHLYDNICEGNNLMHNMTGKIGKYLQVRPKIGSKGNYLYAFYFKKELLNQIIF